MSEWYAYDAPVNCFSHLSAPKPMILNKKTGEAHRELRPILTVCGSDTCLRPHTLCLEVRGTGLIGHSLPGVPAPAWELLQQYHFPRLGQSTCFKLIQVNTGRQCAAVKFHSLDTRIKNRIVEQSCDFLTCDVVHAQIDS